LFDLSYLQRHATRRVPLVTADPNDPGMRDVVFDTATPQLIPDLARGAL
jgi:hypothetical protein